MKNEREVEASQAAERLRLAMECEEFAADLEDILQSDVDPQLPRDLVTLAKAYLDERKSDDGEAITEEWIKDQGYKLLSGMDYCVAASRSGSTAIVRMSYPTVVFVSNFYIPITTRGQLRLLLRALSPEQQA